MLSEGALGVSPLTSILSREEERMFLLIRV